MEDYQARDLLPFVAVALLWGVTNCFIERSVKQSKEALKPFDFSLRSLLDIILRRSYLIAMGINQLGSVFYCVLLGSYSERYSSLAANSLTIVVTFLTEIAMKKYEGIHSPIKASHAGGLLLILTGVWLIFSGELS